MLPRLLRAWAGRDALHAPALLMLELAILALYTQYVQFDTAVEQQEWNTRVPLWADVHVMASSL